MATKRTYRILLAVLTIGFSFVWAQRMFKVWDFNSLGGAQTKHPKPTLGINAWLDGDFQSQFDKYSTDSFGFQSPLVRLVNELDFQMFNAANARYVVVGKNNYLYETPYIEAVTGMDYLGRDSIKSIATKVGMIQDTLSKLGVRFEILFAPGKGSYYPEHIPNYYKYYTSDSTNYAVFKDEFSRQNIPYLDFHNWFRAMKDTTSYPLFPTTGIHWSKYGMVLATDSIINHWNQLYPNQVANFSYSLERTPTTKTESTDADVEEGMNLMTELHHYPMMYPNYTFGHKDSLITSAVIADSYYWGLFDVGLSTRACENGEFWYYFQQVYPQNFESGLMIKDLDLKEAIESKDVIMILQTDATLDRFGFGFVEAAYKQYFID